MAVFSFAMINAFVLLLALWPNFGSFRAHLFHHNPSKAMGDENQGPARSLDLVRGSFGYLLGDYGLKV